MARVTFVFLFALVAALAAPVAEAATSRTTKVSLNSKVVSGSLGKQALRGRAVITTPASWRRTSRNTAPTGRFTTRPVARCSVELQVSGRAVASHDGARDRARRATRSPRAILGQGIRKAGYWRLVQLRSNAPGAYVQNPPDVYGIAVVRLARARWVDVRAFGWFTGCTQNQIRRGNVSAALKTLLRKAVVTARIVRR